MDFDPRIISDGEGQGWYYNFHFGFGNDIIEDAENEKCCVQALRCLIAKADAEIHDLEDELAILQCQLKWFDSNELTNPYEICCATFERKKDILAESIKNVSHRNVLNGHEINGIVKNGRPAERISDIINALVRKKNSAADEQVEDLSKEKNYPVNSGSIVDIGTGLKQKEPTSESQSEFKELTTDLESLYKHADTVSEESCSDTARYVIKDSIVVKDASKTVFEVIGKTEVDACECTAEEENGYFGNSKAINNGGNTTLNALRHGDNNEECLTVSKSSGSDSSYLSAMENVIVKVEEDYDDANIQHITADPLCKTQDHKSEFPIEDHQEVKYLQFQSAGTIQFTYERKKSSLNSLLLKKQKQKLQTNNPSEAGQYNPSLMQKTRGMIGKKEVHSGKKRKLPGATRKNANNLFHEVNFSTEVDHWSSGNLASKSQNELVVCLEAPRNAEGIALLHVSSPADPHNVESNSTIVEGATTKGSLAYNFEELKTKFSQDPNFLTKMKMAQLKDILKSFNVRGLSKMKKDRMIEELSMRLRVT